MVRRAAAVVGAAVLGVGFVVVTPTTAAAVNVDTEAELRAAWADPAQTEILLDVSLVLSDCGAGVLTRNSGTDIRIAASGRPHTITQSCANQGVLVQNGTGAITLVDVTITGGHTPDNGGAIKTKGSVTLNNSTLTGNRADGEGGAISVTDDLTTVTLNNSAITNNQAGFEGGGISAPGARTGRTTVRLNDGSRVTGNQGGITASGGGGGIHAREVFVTDSTVSDNTMSQGIGGGIFADQDATIVRSTLSGNHANGDGGAIAASNLVVVTNSTLAGNSTNSRGGAVYSDSVRLTFATVVGNTAVGSNGDSFHARPEGSFSSFGSVIMRGTANDPNCAGYDTLESKGYNYANDASCGLTQPSDRQNAGNPQLGALADNGGPTFTMLPADSSPLVDMIPQSACPSSITTDQRGVPRPQGGTCDIGSVELELPPGSSAPTDTVSDTVANRPAANATSNPVAANAITAAPRFTG